MKEKQIKDSSYFRVLMMNHGDVQVVAGAIILWGNVIDGQAMFTCRYLATIVVILCYKTIGEEAELNAALGVDSSLILSNVQFYRTTDPLYFPRDVCGVATSAVNTYLDTKTPRISALCYQWSTPVCKNEGSKVSSTAIVTCRNHTSGEPGSSPGSLCRGPGFQKYSSKVTTKYDPRNTVSSIEPKICMDRSTLQRSECSTDRRGFNEQTAKYELESGNKEFEFALLRQLMFTDQDYPEDLMSSGSKENNKDNEDYNKDEEDDDDDDDDEDYNQGWGDDSAELDEDSDEEDYLDEPSNPSDYARRSVGKNLGSYVVPRDTREFDSVGIDKRAETPSPDADNCHDTELGGTDGPLNYLDYDPEHGDGWDEDGNGLEGRGKAGPIFSPSMLCRLAALLSLVLCPRQ